MLVVRNILMCVVAVFVLDLVVVIVWCKWDARRPVAPVSKQQAMRLADEALAVECAREGVSPKIYTVANVERITARDGHYPGSLFRGTPSPKPTSQIWRI